MKNNFFFGCLGVSLTLHATFLAIASLPQSPLKPPRANKMIEIAYERRVAVEKTRPPKPDLRVPEIEKTKLPALENVVPQELFSKPQQEKTRENIFNDTPPVPPGKNEGISVKRIDDVPDIPGEILKMPEYTSYDQQIRGKIRKYAFFYFKKSLRGDVFLNFVLDQNGDLLELAIDEKKSTDDPYLKSIAEKSIRQASPFPAFPEKLKKNKKIPFSVTISFIIN